MAWRMYVIAALTQQQQQQAGTGLGALYIQRSAVIYLSEILLIALCNNRNANDNDVKL